MAAGALPHFSRAIGFGRRLRGPLHGAAVAALCSIAPLGALFFPQETLLFGGLSAGLAGGFVRFLHIGSGDLPPLPHPAVAATAMALLSAAVAGAAVFGLGLLAGGGAVLAVAAVVGGWGGDQPDTRRDRTTLPAPQGSHDESLRQLLRAVHVGALFDEWRRIVGTRVPRDRRTASEERLRRLLLAELERRDPVGCERWRSEAPDAPPDGYVRD